ncbi:MULTISPECIES: hypothetical protein [Halomonas]|uniref:hypothetical protein n=1 Tax=Halomonas TaxID=2745 RepID=UPI001C95B1A8|nr:MULTISPECIES: hypothetical protein [Halomonas]MBY6230656.1 hypothetical protein [Halomonas sp. DP3Y7-1]MCA0918717.1 hypothetical protein [Halomonas denitrificans]
MPLGSVLRLQLEQEVEDRVRHEAAFRGVAYQVVLREKIDQAMDLAGQVAAFRREMDAGFYDLRERQEDLTEWLTSLSAPGQGDTGANPSAVYELLLLMRSLAGTERLGRAHREMKRLGLTPYNPDNP